MQKTPQTMQTKRFKTHETAQAIKGTGIRKAAQAHSQKHRAASCPDSGPAVGRRRARPAKLPCPEWNQNEALGVGWNDTQRLFYKCGGLFQQNVKRVHLTEAPCSSGYASIEFSVRQVKAAV